MTSLTPHSHSQNPWNPDDYRIARRKMVETQIKRRGIKDFRVLQAMTHQVPRHFFVDQAQAAQAYLDAPLPIGYGQTISQPYIVALMIEALGLNEQDRVLEVGFGSGYQTGILASIVSEVYAVERIEALFHKGKENLSRLELNNIHLKLDDGTLGWPEQAPYQAIIVAAGGPRVPLPLVKQLATGGRLIIPVGSDQQQKLILVTKDDSGQVTRQDLGDCRFVALVGRHGRNATAGTFDI